MSNKPKMAVAKPGVVARYAHAKLDGHFVRVQRHASGNAQVTTSHPTDITGRLPMRIVEECERLPPGTVALGELWVPGKPASCVKTAIKHGWTDLRITYFALERHPDWIGQRAELDHADIEQIHSRFASCELEFAPYEVIDVVPVELGEGQLEHYRARARSAGLEGWVLKTGNMTGWAKLKCENSIDLVVTGYKDSVQGKYIGQIGSLLCSTAEGHEVAAVSGMTDDQRTDITEMCDDGTIAGRVIEVEYQRVDSKGRLRHPRFVQFRDDKRPEECALDQDPDLLKHWDRSSRFVETEPEKYLTVEPKDDASDQ